MNSWRLVLTVVLAALPLWCRAEALDLRTGAWETTWTTTITGNLIPKETLDKMPPERRAKFEEAMRARAGKTNTHTTTGCVTKQDLDRGQFLQSENKNCTRKVITQSARHLEIEETCAAPENSKTHAKFDATSTQDYVGSMDRVQGDGGKMHLETSGRWLGPTCKKGGKD
jgi:hypothetical protein